MRHQFVTGLTMLWLAGCGHAAAPADAPAAEETRPAETSYRPAFTGQTRAPRPATVPHTIEKVAEGLDTPWALAFLPDGRLLVSERGGHFRFVGSDGTPGPRMAASPSVHAKGQGGLLDVVLDPDHATNGLVWWSYAEPRGKAGNGTAVARGVLDASGDAPRFTDVRTVFRQQPAWASSLHYGSRLVFAPDGTLFVTLGERFTEESRVLAQKPENHIGKVVRIDREGRAAAGQPFGDDALPEVWSIGHRNIEAAAIDPATGALWTIEHGPKGGDELNLTEAGRNYGWPVISYGINYDGSKVAQGITAREGMEQPVYYWDPVIAPSGMAFYRGDAFPEWQGDIFVGGLAGQKLVRLQLKDGKVVAEEWLATDLKQRIRDVREGPDGFLYLLTEEGEIHRLRPAG